MNQKFFKMKNNITGRVELEINAPVEKVWEALTKPEIIKQYFFGTNTFTDWKMGSPIIFRGEWEGKTYEDKGTILEVDKYKMIKYDYWSSMSGIEDKPENYVIITYHLTQVDSKTKLVITQENIPDEKMKEHSEENWKKIMTDMKRLVEKKSFSLSA
ncbi:MAG: SRPBCC domain-containing protein [Bacteroidetes bacterium]|nr:MAG: SRPBCC domain-containing protein [Bacteroidota bacterium]